jgi:pimeloyl-ACP methyl ester carboxylesterase
MNMKCKLVQELVRHIGQPVHLVGHSFGGTVALAAALSRTVDIASLSLFEANPIPLIREPGGGKLYDETLRMSQAFEAAVTPVSRTPPHASLTSGAAPASLPPCLTPSKPTAARRPP